MSAFSVYVKENLCEDWIWTSVLKKKMYYSWINLKRKKPGCLNFEFMENKNLS